MTDEPTPAQPDLEKALGWVVTDPDGNVVASGSISEAQAAFLVGDSEGEQQ